MHFYLILRLYSRFSTITPTPPHLLSSRPQGLLALAEALVAPPLDPSFELPLLSAPKGARYCCFSS